MYTDTFDSYRVIETIEDGITKQSRQQVLTSVPCRAYQNATNQPNMTETAAMINNSNVLCCELGWDVKGGDEIILHRGANVGRYINPDERYIAGPPNIYVEPFAGVCPDLEHMQIALIDEHVIS
jgi:hypothetical protein